MGVNVEFLPKSDLRVSVVVAAESYLLRAGLTALIQENNHFHVLPPQSPRALAGLLSAESPDVVVYPIPFRAGGTEQMRSALEILQQYSPRTGLVVLSQTNHGLGSKLLGVGLRGSAFLLFDRVDSSETLFAAIQGAADGLVSIDAEEANQLPQRLGWGGSRIDNPALFSRESQATRSGILSAREHEVLAYLAAGFSNTGIAERLFVSEKTVENNVTAIFRALQLNGNPSLHRRVAAALLFLHER